MRLIHTFGTQRVPVLTLPIRAGRASGRHTSTKSINLNEWELGRSASFVWSERKMDRSGSAPPQDLALGRELFVGRWAAPPVGPEARLQSKQDTRRNSCVFVWLPLRPMRFARSFILGFIHESLWWSSSKSMGALLPPL